MWDGNGCLFCHDVVDISSANDDLISEEAKRDRDRIYGVDVVDLGEAGPSVVSINGIIASTGVTEFMLAVTGLVKEPRRHLTYRGHMGTVAVSTDAGDGELLLLPDDSWQRERRGCFQIRVQTNHRYEVMHLKCHPAETKKGAND